MIPRLDADQMKTLAVDIVASRVFGSWNVREGDEDLLQSIFMIFALGGGIDKSEAADLGGVYEYLSEAGPRAINGYPIFFSARLLHKEDLGPLQEKITAVRAAIDGA